MHTSSNVFAAIAMVILSMLTLALLLLGLPELHFVAGRFSESHGPYSANIADLLSRAGSPDEFACSAADLMSGCSYWALTIHALVFQLTPESQDLLLRHLVLMLGGWFLLVGIGFLNFARAWRAQESILNTRVFISVPIVFVQCVLAIVAMAYLLSLANWA